ncbi:response regulator transcription factor [Paraburkholderia solisilvae]|uniref:response regulator transcription factor n=1 Tax=Paraburkholderia solisilvae TaxID=624376 RepID=UPI0035EAE1C9
MASLEDDLDQARQIEALLVAAGHEVQTFSEGRKLIRFLETDKVDLLMLDWHVPDISGLEVLNWARTRLGPDLPILFLTSSSLEEEIVHALNAGADDYMVKPWRELELSARITALLRRAYPPVSEQSRIEIGNYVIDLDKRSVTVCGTPVTLTPREFDIAAVLFRNIGQIMPRDLLVKLIWGRDLAKASRSIDTYVYRVRQKLSLGLEHGVRLRTIYTHGYRLEHWVSG